MAIDPISLGQTAPVGSVSGGASSAPVAGDVARAISTAVVGRIASALMLAPPSRHGGDGYGIGALADAVASQFPGSPAASVGNLARAMESFASAVAVDMAALADGRTLDRVDQAITDFAPHASAQGVETVTAFLEQAAARILDAR